MTEQEIKLKIKSLIIEVLTEFHNYSNLCYQMGTNQMDLFPSSKLNISKESFLLSSNLGISFSAEISLKSLFVLGRLNDIVNNIYEKIGNNPGSIDFNKIREKIDEQWKDIIVASGLLPNNRTRSATVDNIRVDNHSYWSSYCGLTKTVENLFKYIFITSNARDKGNNLPLQGFKTSAIDYYIITQGIISEDDLEKDSKNANNELLNKSDAFAGKRYKLKSVDEQYLDTVKQIAYAAYVACEYSLNIQKEIENLPVDNSIIEELAAAAPSNDDKNLILASLTDVEKHILSTKFEKDEIDCLTNIIKENKTEGGISVLEFIKHAIFFKYSLSGNIFKYNDERCQNILTLFNALSRTTNIREASDEIKEWFATKSIYDLNEYELEELDKIDPVFLFQSLGASQKLKYSKDKPISQMIMEEYAVKKEFIKDYLQDKGDIKRIPLYYYLFPKETIVQAISKVEHNTDSIYTIPSEYFNKLNYEEQIVYSFLAEHKAKFGEEALQDTQKGFINIIRGELLKRKGSFILSTPVDINYPKHSIEDIISKKYFKYKNYNFPKCIIKINAFWEANSTIDYFQFSDKLIKTLQEKNIDIQNFFNSIMHEELPDNFFQFIFSLKELINSMIEVYQFLSTIEQEIIFETSTSFFQIVKYYNSLKFYIKGTDLSPLLYATDYKINLLLELLNQYFDDDDTFEYISNHLIYLLYFDEEVLEQNVGNALSAIDMASRSANGIELIKRENILNAYNIVLRNSNITLRHDIQR